MKVTIFLFLLLVGEGSCATCPCLAGEYSDTNGNLLTLYQQQSGIFQGTYVIQESQNFDSEDVYTCFQEGEWTGQFTSLTGNLTFARSVCRCEGECEICDDDGCSGSHCLSDRECVSEINYPAALSSNCNSLQVPLFQITAERIANFCSEESTTSTPASTTTFYTSSTEASSTTIPTTKSTVPCPSNCICSSNTNICSTCMKGYKNPAAHCTELSTACLVCKSIFKSKQMVEFIQDLILEGDCALFAIRAIPFITVLCLPLSAPTGEVALPLCDVIGTSLAFFACYEIKKYIPTSLKDALKMVMEKVVDKMGNLLCSTPSWGFCPKNTSFEEKSMRAISPAPWPGDLHLKISTSGALTSQYEARISTTFNKLLWNAENETAAGTGYMPCSADNTGTSYQFSDESPCLQHQGECEVNQDIFSAFLQSLAQLSASVTYGPQVQSGNVIFQNWTLLPLPLLEGLEVVNPDVPPLIVQYVTNLDNEPISISIIYDGAVGYQATVDEFEDQPDFDIDLPTDASSCKNDDFEVSPSSALFAGFFLFPFVTSLSFFLFN